MRSLHDIHIYVVAYNRPLLSFPVRRQKIQIFASSTQPQREVSQLSTQARQKWQLSCWGSSAQKKLALAINLSGSGGQKRGWQQRPFIMWQGEGATKPKVYYGRRQIGFGQRGTQWESPWWVKENWRNVEIGQKSSYFPRASNCQLMIQRINKQVVAIQLQSRWLDPDQTQGEADSIGRSRFTLGWWSLTTTSSSEWWSGWKDIQQQKTLEPLFLIRD